MPNFDVYKKGIKIGRVKGAVDAAAALVRAKLEDVLADEVSRRVERRAPDPPIWEVDA